MKRLLASCFGLGRLPLAPGTWGSLPPVVLFALMGYLEAPAAAISIVMAALALLGCVVCVEFAPASIAATGKADPREVVADEFAGQAVTFMAIPAVPTNQIWLTAVLGFLLFRFLDIAKPWPSRKLEKLRKGWGILADDLMAAAYAGVALFLFRSLGLVEYLDGLLRAAAS